MTTQSWIAPIYFDIDEVECLAEEETSVPLTYKLPIILPAESQLEPHAVTESYIPLTEIKRKKTKLATTFSQQTNVRNTVHANSVHTLLWLAGAVSVLLILMLLVDAYVFIIEQYERSVLLGSIFLILFATIITTVSLLSWRAYRNLCTLRKVTELQQEGQTVIAKNGYGNAVPYLQKITNFYAKRTDIQLNLEKFYLTLSDSYQDDDVCHLFSHQVMSELDQQAYRIVVQRAKETAIIVAVSPVALLDTVLTLWRNAMMIQDIATLYGGRPGFLGSISLINTVLQNIIYADVSEMLADSLAETLGGSMLAIFSAQAAQGLGSGVMTARVGLKAIHTCRPLPFFDEEKPRLKDIRKEIVNSIKSIFEKK